MHVSTEYVTVKRNIVDTNAQKGINRVSNSIATILNVLDNSKRILKEYRMELRDIQDIAAKFGYLLMVHSNMVSFLNKTESVILIESQTFDTVTQQIDRTVFGQID